MGVSGVVGEAGIWLGLLGAEETLGKASTSETVTVRAGGRGIGIFDGGKWCEVLRESGVRC